MEGAGREEARSGRFHILTNMSLPIHFLVSSSCCFLVSLFLSVCDSSDGVRQQVEELLEQGRGKESTVAAEAASLREELQAKTRLCDLAKQAGVDMERQLESLKGQNFGMGQRLAAAQAAEAAAQSELQQVNQQRPLHALNSLKIVEFDLF